MSESQLQFRVGIFVIIALSIMGVMVFQFGEFKSVWEKHYPLTIRFEEAPGVYQYSPVKMNGVVIGSVRAVQFDPRRGGVDVLVDVREKYRLRKDSRPRLVRSLLGDTTIEFTPGVSPDLLEPGDVLEGEPPTDPMEIVRHLDSKVSTTLDSFHATSREWQIVAQNLNDIMETNHGNLEVVVERTAEALYYFSITMRTANEALRNANKIVSDPEYQASLRESLEALPHMVRETRETVLAIRRTVVTLEDTLQNIKGATAPLAKHSDSIASRLNNSLGHLELMLADLNRFSQMVAEEDGSLKKFVADPELYQNLNASAASLAVLLKNLEPVVRDLRIFSDKVARHPELMGVGGAIHGSSGLKVEPDPTRQSQFQAPNAPPLR